MLDSNNPIPRRDFIKKSIVASGGLFVGMAIGEKVFTPTLTALAAPNSASSRIKGNNGLGNGEDPPPPGIDMQGKDQNDDPANPGDPQYQGTGSN